MATYFDSSSTSQVTRKQAGATSLGSSDIAAALEYFGAVELAGSPVPVWDIGAKLPVVRTEGNEGNEGG